LSSEVGVDGEVVVDHIVVASDVEGLLADPLKIDALKPIETTGNLRARRADVDAPKGLPPTLFAEGESMMHNLSVEPAPSVLGAYVAASQDRETRVGEVVADSITDGGDGHGWTLAACFGQAVEEDSGGSPFGFCEEAAEHGPWREDLRALQGGAPTVPTAFGTELA